MHEMLQCVRAQMTEWTYTHQADSEDHGKKFVLARSAIPAWGQHATRGKCVVMGLNAGGDFVIVTQETRRVLAGVSRVEGQGDCVRADGQDGSAAVHPLAGSRGAYAP